MSGVSEDLVYDVGVNHGEDSEFYLAKGLRVVAIEANPILAEELSQKFSEQITSGQYTLLPIGIWDAPGSLPFYQNHSNDHFSSFDHNYGSRDGDYTVVEVECRTIASVLDEFGLPHYMKIDVEGADNIILRALRDYAGRPSFISVEEYGHQALLDLRALGYDTFKIVTQNDKSQHIPPSPALEGNYVERTFDGRDSGLFGRELPGSWMSFPLAYQLYTETIRAPDGTFLYPKEDWFDIHARLPAATSSTRARIG